MNDYPRVTARSVLASDLDGTLIPLEDNARNRADLATLAQLIQEHQVGLVFSTGRHLESVHQAIEEQQLPQPEWIICDVGTSIYRRNDSGEFHPVEAYLQHEDDIIAQLPIPELRQLLGAIDGLRLQEEEKQGRHKLSYYADASRLDELVAHVQQELERVEAPYSIIHSVDPFNGDGLIDLLPAKVSKAYALRWWCDYARLSREAVLFAGDSGNDLAALTSGYRAIVMGNADRNVAQQAYRAHRNAGWHNRLYLARGHATSGLLEGCRWFELFPQLDAETDRLGATPVNYRKTHFRVWAPKRERVAVELHTGKKKKRYPLERQADGYFAGTLPRARPGTLYEYVLDDQVARPDPTSRFQPKGVHGPSQVVDPNSYPWTDSEWTGIEKRDLVIYELHVGTWTKEGTFRAAINRLPELVELGITAVEVMPVAQSPGRWNWGYDGVNLFAVRNSYGGPEEFKAFIDACHQHGLAVLLDVVYNHLGPEGNYLADFGPYFSTKHHTPWGQALNFDGKHSGPVRNYILENARYWLEEYHLDGLRLDAVLFMIDDSEPTILQEVRREVAKLTRRTHRKMHMIAEANVYDRNMLISNAESLAYDAIWCDCLMHAIYSHAVPELKLTAREYQGPGDLEEALRYGYVYSGKERTRVSAEQRQALVDDPHDRAHIASFVTALQTHDSVGNHPQGKRFHQLASKSFQRAAAALVLLYPSIPLVFMGEEYAAETPFPFFADFEDYRLRQAVDRGRTHEYPHHDWGDSLLPSEAAAFYDAKCHDRDSHDRQMFAWYQQLIALRKQGLAEGWLAIETMTPVYDSEQDIFALRFQGPDGTHVSIRARLTALSETSAQPIAVPLEGELLLSSENTEVRGGQIQLHPQHAIISRS